MKTIQEFFANAVSSNPELQAQINAAKSSAEIVKLAAAAGYALAEEAIVSFISGVGQSEELSDSDLASVAGGQRPDKPTTQVTSQGVTKCCW